MNMSDGFVVLVQTAAPLLLGDAFPEMKLVNVCVKMENDPFSAASVSSS